MLRRWLLGRCPAPCGVWLPCPDHRDVDATVRGRLLRAWRGRHGRAGRALRLGQWD